MAVSAALSVPMLKLSGRGLGHTGGTIDKLESIPGFSMSLPTDRLMQNVREIGIAIGGQTAELAPADKKLYALRDVTGTTESIPLIAASIMSKKIASGADAVVIDVKVGSGAFMKTLRDAELLAQTMVSIGEAVNLKVTCLITDMETPLGTHIGNALEIEEVLSVLSGGGDKRLTELSMIITAYVLRVHNTQGEGQSDIEYFKKLAYETIENGTALLKFNEMVTKQGGDISKLPTASHSYEVRAESNGYISEICAHKAGMASMLLGAGRETVRDDIDYTAGIILKKQNGDFVGAGSVIAVLYADSEVNFIAAAEMFLSGVKYSRERVELPPVVYKAVAG
jgi:pyrimidine-nucleoside phosphorylase